MDAIALYVLEKNDQAWCVHRTVHIVYASNLAQAFWTAIAAFVVCIVVTVAVSLPSLMIACRVSSIYPADMQQFDLQAALK
jgi:hypothetical protein